MKLTRLYFSLMTICTVIIFTNCQKKTEIAIGSDYMPLTPGSTWTYSSSGSSFTLAATNRDTVANGKTYRVVTNSAGSNYYFGKNGNEYYRYGALAALNLSGVEELYLKDNLDVSGTWATSQVFNAPGIPIPLTANLTHAIKSKGGSRTVSGKTFNDVIHVRLDISVTGFGSVGGGDFYYAKNIGMIENTFSVTLPGQNIAQSQLLIGYEIK
jgi:hypothetical protein